MMRTATSSGKVTSDARKMTQRVMRTHRYFRVRGPDAYQYDYTEVAEPFGSVPDALPLDYSQVGVMGSTAFMAIPQDDQQVAIEALRTYRPIPGPGPSFPEASASVEWYMLSLLRTLDRGAIEDMLNLLIRDISADDAQADLKRLIQAGQESVARNIRQYLDLRAEEGAPSVMPDSLRHFAEFLISYPNLVPPVVSADPQGNMELEWHLRDNGRPDTVWGRGNGVVSLRFLETGTIQYVALSGPYKAGIERLTKNGETDAAGVMERLGEFAGRVKHG
jgi:hypothetical protein